MPGKNSFRTQVFAGSLLVALLLVTPIHAQSGDQTPSHKEVARVSDSKNGSPYIPIDSWIYPAALRLYYLGYLPTAYIGLRPWTRASLAHMLTLSKDAIESAYAPDEAIEIYARLSRELAPELADHSSFSVHTESVYTRLREIRGPILNDSFHFGQTIVNDYGRPDQPGFNNISGVSGVAKYGRFSLYVRSEWKQMLLLMCSVTKCRSEKAMRGLGRHSVPVWAGRTMPPTSTAFALTA
jgi:hypothetical protein